MSPSLPSGSLPPPSLPPWVVSPSLCFHPLSHHPSTSPSFFRLISPFPPPLLPLLTLSFLRKRGREGRRDGSRPHPSQQAFHHLLGSARVQPERPYACLERNLYVRSIVINQHGASPGDDQGGTSRTQLFHRAGHVPLFSFLRPLARVYPRPIRPPHRDQRGQRLACVWGDIKNGSVSCFDSRACVFSGGREGEREGKGRTKLFLEHLADHARLGGKSDNGHVDPLPTGFQDEG